jgi:hypothetical protein
LPKLWLWDSGMRQLVWRIFVSMMSWASATDQLITACMSEVVFILATKALRSVTLLS